MRFSGSIGKLVDLPSALEPPEGDAESGVWGGRLIQEPQEKLHIAAGQGRDVLPSNDIPRPLQAGLQREGCEVQALHRRGLLQELPMLRAERNLEAPMLHHYRMKRNVAPKIKDGGAHRHSSIALGTHAVGKDELRPAEISLRYTSKEPCARISG
jgi:hypothetical protein